MTFRELNPWTPGTRGVESLTLNLLWKWYKLRIHYKITCEFYARIYPHKRVFLGFWIAKTHELPGAPLPGPLPGGWSLRWTAWYENSLWNCIKSELIKLQFNTVTNMLRHIIIKKRERKKSMKVRTWSKLRPKRLGSDRVNATLRNMFSRTFKVLKPMSFRGLRPLDSTKGPKSGP